VTDRPPDDPGSAGAPDADSDTDQRRFHVDGDLVPESEATVSVLDRGFAYGDAAAETIRVYGGVPFRWAAHAGRLERSCDRLGIDDAPAASELRRRVGATVTANGFEEARVRVSVTRGTDEGGVAPTRTSTPTVVVVAAPLPRGGAAGTTPWDDPAALATVRTRWPADRALPADARTHSAVPRVLAARERRAAGTDEAVVLDADGAVVGGVDATLFFVDDDALHTPGRDGPVWPGVARSLVLELAREEGLPVEEGRYRPADLRDASEVFLADPIAEVRPVSTVDGIEVPGGPIAALLGRLYDERVDRACYGSRNANGDRNEDESGS